MPEIQPSSDRSQSASGRRLHAARSAATPAPAAIHFHVDPDADGFRWLTKVHAT